MDRTSLLRLLLAAVLAVLLIAGAGWTTTAHAHGDVIVNGALLGPHHAAALEQRYRTRLMPGRYWYDAMSGLWGLEGGASVGMIAPGLPFGRMDPSASVGRRAGITGVFVNGREIHPDELSYLRALYGPVVRARYWLNARGIAGYEGGPPQFNLVAAAQQSRGSSHLRRGLFGSTGSDGSCSYYMHPNGSSVMTGRC